jgi:DNA-directed RNA polymerase specialized sigma subunit
MQPRHRNRIEERRTLSCERRTIASGVARQAVKTNATDLAGPAKFSAEYEALIREHAGLVRCIAYHLFRRRRYVNVDDLIRAGMIGLFEAVYGFGQETTGSFEDYASGRIRQTMLAFVRASDWRVRVGPEERAAS